MAFPTSRSDNWFIIPGALILLQFLNEITSTISKQNNCFKEYVEEK